MPNKNQKRFPVYYNADTVTGKKIAKWLSKQDNASDSVRMLILTEEVNKKELASLKEQVKLLIKSLSSQGPRLTEKETESLHTIETVIGKCEERAESNGSSSFYFDDEE